VIDDTEFGWGTGESSRSAAAVSAAALVVAAGLYGASVWLASGLHPLPALLQIFKGASGAHEHR
jgi:hypothetical protein